MSLHWSVRWFAMLVVFALTTFTFSAYAGAAPPPDSETDGDHHEVTYEAEEEATTQSERAERNADERVTVIERSPEYMLTITRSAFLGALLGGLIGGSIYLIAGRELSPWIIGYSAAGGVFTGTLVGIMEVTAREARAARAQRQRLDTFDEALHEEAQQREPEGMSIPLLRLDF